MVQDVGKVQDETAHEGAWMMWVHTKTGDWYARSVKCYLVVGPCH